MMVACLKIVQKLGCDGLGRANDDVIDVLIRKISQKVKKTSLAARPYATGQDAKGPLVQVHDGIV